MADVTRRDFLKDGARTLAVSAVLPFGLTGLAAKALAVRQGGARIASSGDPHLQLAGYADQISVTAGETIRFMVHSESPTVPGGPQAYEYTIRRVLNVWPGLDLPDNEATYGPPAFAATRHPGQYQPHDRVGSRIVVPATALGNALTGGFTLTGWFYPYSPRDPQGAPIGPSSGTQSLFAIGDGATYPSMTLEIASDAASSPAHFLRLRIATSSATTHTVVLPVGISILEWHFVAMSYDATSGSIVLYMRAQADDGRRGDPHSVAGSVPSGLGFDGDLSIGARQMMGLAYRDHFNGVVSDLMMFDRALSVADLAADSESALRKITGLAADWRIEIDPAAGGAWRLMDYSGNSIHGELINCPTTGVPGHNYLYKLYPLVPEAPTNGRPDLEYRRSPSLYNAAHLHEDDLSDSGWEESFTWTVPASARSGVYVAEIVSDVLYPDGENLRYYIPFIVAPAPSDTADVLYIAPTLTWQGYANGPSDAGWPSAYGNGGFYGAHSDGSPTCYASRRRPMPWMIPNVLHRFLNNPKLDENSIGQDLFFLYWLEKVLPTRHQLSPTCHVMGDEDLDAVGRDLRKTRSNRLRGKYKVLVTGAHPEYWTPDMRLAVDDFVRRGGNLMYLGGNGQYWVTSFAPDPRLRHVAEVRKRFGSGLAGGLETPPGEYFHSTVPKLLGGLWLGEVDARGRRKLRNPPQRLLGVGFSGGAEGENWHPFSRTEESHRTPVQFVFEGVDGEEFGKNPDGSGYGLFKGYAIGVEIDRYDHLLKSPASTVVLATSRPIIPPTPPETTEGILTFMPEDKKLFPGRDPADVRRVDITLGRRGRGMVFAAGSRAWTGALPVEPSPGAPNDVSQITANVLKRFLS